MNYKVPRHLLYMQQGLAFVEVNEVKYSFEQRDCLSTRF